MNGSEARFGPERRDRAQFVPGRFRRPARRLLAPWLALGLFLPLASVAQERSPLGRGTLTVVAIGGPNFLAGTFGPADIFTPTIDVGKFYSRRIEAGLDLHPYIAVRQPVTTNGQGKETVGAAALAIYGRWYPGPFDWRARPYVEIANGPYYASRPTPKSGTRFNFLSQFGVGSSLPLRDQWSLVVGYRWVHISNAGIGRSNPSWDFNGIVLGVRKYLTR